MMNSTISFSAFFDVESRIEVQSRIKQKAKMGTFKIKVFISFLIVVQSTYGIRNANGTLATGSRKLKRDSTQDLDGLLSTYGTPHFFNGYSYSNRPMNDWDMPWHDTALLNFPVGTRLTLTPAIKVPLLKKKGASSDSKTSLNLELPIEVIFKKHSRDMENVLEEVDHIFRFGESSNPQELQTEPQSKRVDPRHVLSRKLREVNATKYWKHENQDGWCPSKSFSDRRNILLNIELLAGKFVGQDDAKECLLRWACELHKRSQVAKQYGLIGEGVLQVFSVEEIFGKCDKRDAQVKFFKPFVKAEVAGKAGNCRPYEKKCSLPLFVYA